MKKKLDKIWIEIQVILFLDEITLWWIMYNLESRTGFQLYESVMMVIVFGISVYELLDMVPSVNEIHNELWTV